jgi:hypothetical protein
MEVAKVKLFATNDPGYDTAVDETFPQGRAPFWTLGAHEH